MGRDAGRAVRGGLRRVTGADAIVDRARHAALLARPVAAPSRAARPARGADVTEIGLCSTDELYFACGALDLPGAMFTASHNPAQYNGIKMCRAGAAPVGQDTGLADIRALVEAWSDAGAPSRPPAPGTITRRDILADYAGAPARPGGPDAASAR